MLLVFQVFSASGQTDPYTYPRQEEAVPPNPHAGTPDTPEAVNCNNLSSDPCPFDDDPFIYFNVNIHFLLTATGAGNFTETGDGFGNAYTGFQRAEDIVDEANRQLLNNVQGWNSNTTAVCSLKFRLVLRGVYFHRTNTGLVQTNPVPRYAPSSVWSGVINSSTLVNPSSEINCYFFNSNYASGQANGIHATVHDDWFIYHREGNVANNYFLSLSAKVLLHEIFHNNGLWDHPFAGNDPCDDTPTLPRCWGYNSNDPNCDTWQEISNNLMDYGQWIDEWSLSPCQICRIHENLQPNMVTSTNSCAPISAFFHAPDEVCGVLRPDIWMRGSAAYNESGYQIEVWQVSAVGNPTPVPGTFMERFFNGKVGDVNLRTFMPYAFNCGKIYLIRLTVYSTCGDYTSRTQYVKTSCKCNDFDDVKDLDVMPNPSYGNVTVNYDMVGGNKAVTLTVHNLNDGQVVQTLCSDQLQNAGTYTYSLDLPPGAYFVRAMTADGLYTKQFSIIP